MKTYVVLSGILSVVGWVAAAADEPARHLLLDERIVERSENAVLRTARVTKHQANPLFGEEHPWEARFDNLYVNVLYDEQEELYKAWYFMFTRDAVLPDGSPVPRELRIAGSYKKGFTRDRKTGIGYAFSKDGIHWTKPMMDFVRWEGKPSNLVIEEMEGVGVIKDMREQDASRRYKMFGKWNAKPFSNSLAVAFSPDGVKWSSPIYCPQAEAAADCHNNALWAPELNKYVGFTRLWSVDKPTQRIVGRTESPDFIHWTKAVEVLRGEPNLQTYSMPVFRHAGIYLGLPTILRLQGDQVQTELAWSPDTVNWHRIEPGTALIPNSKKKGDYDWGTAYASFPIFLKDEIRIFYGGCNGPHGDWRDGFLCLATLRPDGFAGYEPQDAAQPAVVVTKPVTLGAELKITADAQDGSITVFVLDTTGKVLLTSRPVTTNVTDERVSWSDGGTLEKLAGQKVRLRFEIRRAKLYSFVL